MKSNAITRFFSSPFATFGLKEIARHPSSGKVWSCVCRFCIVFGREYNVGGKRACTSNVKYFKTFCTDWYQRHISTAHAEIWAEYQELETKDENQKFFKSMYSFVNSLDAHLESSPHIHILVNTPIIKTVSGELLLRTDDVVGMTHEFLLNLFKKLESSGSD